MRWFDVWARLSLVLIVLQAPVMAMPLDQLYSSKVVVTGQGEVNRQAGFKQCLERVLARVSGDQRLTHRPEVGALKTHAGDFVAAFSYHDRLAGKPIHDEQGTYDRPHDLTCSYDPKVIDGILTDLGSRPWLTERPLLAIFLDVERKLPHYRVTPDDPRDAAMRESFALAAAPLAMSVRFPASAGVDSWKAGPSSPFVTELAGTDLPLVGKIAWSDPDFGWVATWRMVVDGKPYMWTVRGVNFDEAFRVAIRGAAQILSGNGEP
jgi:hypothetical protein